MVLNNYSFLVNDAKCSVQIETAEQTVLSEVAAPAISAAPGSIPQTYPVQAHPQITQATWVTARRVAHLPFH